MHPPEQRKRWHQLQQCGVPLTRIDQLTQQQATDQPCAKHHQVGKHCCGLAAAEEATQQESQRNHVVAEYEVQNCLNACRRRNRAAAAAAADVSNIMHSLN
jgi:hypothetical protein